jgi:pilus assembly protein CpaC
MHRTSFLPRPLVWTALLVAFLCGPLAAARAQEQRPTVVFAMLNETKTLQMSQNQIIAEFKSDDPRVARVERIPNELRKIQVIAGNQPGSTMVTLKDDKGKVEQFQLIVETNIEYLRRVLREVFPTSNLIVTGAGPNVILSGNVARAVDVDAIMRTAASIVGDPGRVVNNMTVGGVMQVQLDVCVARVARSKARSMGFSFLESNSHQFISSTVAGPGTLVGNVASGFTGASANLSGTPNVIFGILANSFAFTGYLNALQTENLVKLLAQPKVIALSGQPADFISGGEQAVPDLASGSAGGGAVAGVRFVPFGTTIRVLPIVLGNGKIYLDVEPQFTFPDPSALFSAPIPGTNSVVFGRTTQRVHTSVIMEDGQTFAIGGMIFHSVNASASRVPILGEVPFLGFFFSTVEYTESEEELVILVTPHLVDAMTCDQLPKFLPGQETRSPDDFELFLERILEAPRGPRDVCVNGRYVPAYKNGPAADMYPCPNCNGPRGSCDLWYNGGDGHGGCANGACGQNNGHEVRMVPPGTAPAAPMPGAQTPAPSQPQQSQPQQLPERAQYQAPLDNVVPVTTGPASNVLPPEPPGSSTPAALGTPAGEGGR